MAIGSEQRRDSLAVLALQRRIKLRQPPAHQRCLGLDNPFFPDFHCIHKMNLAS